jgi:hypothetical protein
MSNASDFVIKTGLWGKPDAAAFKKYFDAGVML